MCPSAARVTAPEMVTSREGRVILPPGCGPWLPAITCLPWLLGEAVIIARCVLRSKVAHFMAGEGERRGKIGEGRVGRRGMGERERRRGREGRR